MPAVAVVDINGRLLALVERQATTIETLSAQLVELKRAGFQPKAEKPTKHKVKPPETSDEEIVRQRDREAIERMTRAFMDEGHSEADAKKEATRIRNESTRTTVHPTE